MKQMMYIYGAPADLFADSLSTVRYSGSLEMNLWLFSRTRRLNKMFGLLLEQKNR